MHNIGKSIALVLCAALFLQAVHFVLAENNEVNELENEIANRKSRITDINRQMETYKQKISQYNSETASLMNDIGMIENQIALIELDVAVTELEIEAQQLEIDQLQQDILAQEEQLAEQKEILKEMIFELYRSDSVGVIEVLFGSEDFSALFTQITQLENVNEDLRKTLDMTKSTKERLMAAQTVKQTQLEGLLELQEELEVQVANLDLQRNAKEQLVAETQQSEAEYRVLMSELRQEQQYITNQISALQNEIEQKLADANQDDPIGDPTQFNWPVSRGRITAIFHDPTYPFRHLFEHSGIDIAVVTGTPVRSAAPGVVAWSRYGRSYGNYVMVIHEGGLATIYAHMSRLDVAEGQVVSRGQQLGLSGNTGLSTGPHLHFEARLNGIPTNPRNYLIGNLPR